MEFTGWVTDYSTSSFQGLADGEYRYSSVFSKDWCRNRPKDGLVGTKTRKEQVTRPSKIFVSMWFKHATSLMVMIDLLNMMKDELDKAAYCTVNTSLYADRRTFSRCARHMCLHVWLKGLTIPCV